LLHSRSIHSISRKIGHVIRIVGHQYVHKTIQHFYVLVQLVLKLIQFMYVLSVQYSCVVVSVFLFGEKANLVLFTLYYSTLLALTHRQTENEYTCLAWAGGTCQRFTWAGKTFSPVVLLCQFLVLGGNRFWFLHTTYVLRVSYHTVVVLC
jgi:hypothetical protein